MIAVHSARRRWLLLMAVFSLVFSTFYVATADRADAWPAPDVQGTCDAWHVTETAPDRDWKHTKYWTIDGVDGQFNRGQTVEVPDDSDDTKRSFTIRWFDSEGKELDSRTAKGKRSLKDCEPEPEKVTICHATSAVKNPYTRITVDASAADGIAGNSGQQPDHYGEHDGPVFDHGVDDWGDIIPPIDGVHNGLNWNEAGQAIYANDCNIPEPEGEADLVLVVTDGTCESGLVDVTITNEGDADSTVTALTQDGNEIAQAGALEPGESQVILGAAELDFGQTSEFAVGDASDTATRPSEEECAPPEPEGEFLVSLDTTGASCDTGIVNAVVNNDGDAPTPVLIVMAGDQVAGESFSLEPGKSLAFDEIAVLDFGQSVTVSVRDAETAEVYSSVTRTRDTEENCNPPEEPEEPETPPTTQPEEPEPVDECPNLDGVQEEVPDDMEKDDAGNCVTPEDEPDTPEQNTDSGLLSIPVDNDGGPHAGLLAAAVTALAGAILAIRKMFETQVEDI